jgi:hypothetical protein
MIIRVCEENELLKVNQHAGRDVTTFKHSSLYPITN